VAGSVCEGIVSLMCQRRSEVMAANIPMTVT
jgi:hypothetical protein